MSKTEQETIITLNPTEKTANIWTTDPVWMRKLEKLGAKSNDYSAELDVPKSWIKIVQG